MAAVGAGGSSKEELAEGEIAANGGGGEGSSSKPEKEVLGCWWCGDKGCTYREPASGELVCSGAKNTATILSSKTSVCTARRSMLS